MNKHSKITRKGSALLLTLLVVSLLMVVVLGFVVFVRMQLREVDNQQNLFVARLNAKLGLQIAVSQLQKYAGADQRVTVPATTVYPSKDVTTGTGDLYDDPSYGYRSFAEVSSARSYLDKVETYLVPDERSAWEQALENWWDNGGNSRNPHWTGVYDSSLRVDRASNPTGTPTDLTAERYEVVGTTIFGEPKRSQLPVWLVSGNERLNFNPATDTSYPAGYQTPDISLVTNTNAVELVGAGSATDASTSVDGLDGIVRVLKQPTNDGTYAFWVGDESTKANFSVQAEDPTSLSPSEYRNYLQVPQRVGWERMKGFESVTLDPYDPIFEKVISHNQIGLVGTTPAGIEQLNDTVKENFHHITSYSRSLLTDTALGGLRKDLTRYLEDGDGLNDNDPIADPNRYDPDDARFAAWGGTNTGFPNSSNAALDGIPTWGQIRDWYQNESTGGSGITPNINFAPVITYMNFHMGFSYDPSSQEIRMHWVPAIVLWNPYDVALNSGSYDIDVGHSPAYYEFYIASPGVSAADVTLTDTSPADNIPDNPADEGTFRNNTIPAASETQDFFYALETVPTDWNNKSGIPMHINFGSRSSDSLIGGTNSGKLQRAWNPMRDQYNLPGNDVATQPNDNNTYIAVDQTMKFSITDSFAPGQAKIYTLGGDPAGNIANWDPDDRLALTNSYDAQFPASAWWPVMRIMANGPAADAGATNGLNRTIKWSSALSNASYASPYVRFAISGSTTPISETLALGYVQFDHISKGTRRSNNTESVSQWKHDIPNTANFADMFTPLNTQDTGSLVREFRVWMEPITSTGGSGIAQIEQYYPGFSRFNITRNADKHPLVEALRSRFDDNNSDAMNSFTTFLGSPSSSGSYPNWDENQSADGSEAYSLITFQQKPGGTYLGLSELPIRNAKRANSEILSIGQLQQVNLSPYIWQPSFPIGNSDASPHTDREAIAGINSRIVGGQNGGGGDIGKIGNTGITTNRAGDPVPGNTMMDMSYLLNENLWDSYFLSTINGTPDTSSPLPNGRIRFTANAETAINSELKNFDTAAAYLENAGALNVNSTSIEAWKALLTAFRDLSLGDNPSDTVPIARTLDPIGGSIEFTEATQSAADIGATSSGKDYSMLMNGFRYLTDAMIETLAERIVDEVRLRGPFLSMADFVNRRLVAPAGSGTPGSDWYIARTDGSVGSPTDNHNDYMNPSYDPFIGLQGINGAIQRAVNVSGINGGINHPSTTSTANDRVFSLNMRKGGSADNTSGSFSLGTGTSGQKHTFEPTMRSHLDTEHWAGAPAGEVGQAFQGVPGFVTQGDLLAMIGPALTARGDTFLVRAYGEAGTAAETNARAWIEAVVQRIAEPVTPDASDKWRPTDNFGRRFKVVSMRWLTPDEI